MSRKQQPQAPAEAQPAPAPLPSEPGSYARDPDTGALTRTDEDPIPKRSPEPPVTSEEA